MRKLKMEMQVSLDGYAIGADGGGDWMVWNWSDDWTWDEALRVFHIELTTSSDCILLSRQMVEDGFIEHWEDVATRGDDPQVAMAQPVVDMRKVVFSKSLRSVDKPHCELVRGDVVSEVTKLKEQPGKDLIVYGGPTFVSSLMEAELIDEVHLVVNPVLIGAGVTPFKFLAHHVALRPLEPRRFDCGVVVLSYETVPRSPRKRYETATETPSDGPVMTTSSSVWPCLTYTDATRAIDWLVEAFGFEATYVVPGDDKRPVLHAELRLPSGGGVILGSRAEGDPDPIASRPAGTGNIYVVASDPVALYSRCSAAGAEMVNPMETTEYGSTGFSVRDLEGNLWSFGTIPPGRPEL